MSKGKLIIAGGALEIHDKIVHKQLIEFAGGKGSKLAVIATASGADPVYSINYVKELWAELGVDEKNIVIIPVFCKEGKSGRTLHVATKMKSLQC